MSKCSPNNTITIAQNQTTKPQWAQCVKCWSKCCLFKFSPNNNTTAIAQNKNCKKCKRRKKQNSKREMQNIQNRVV